MIEKHVAEEMLQDFALGGNLPGAMAEHIEHCVKCQVKISEYQLLFSKLQEQEKDVFDFNVSELVLPHLQQEKSKFVWDKWLIYLAAFSVVGVLAGILYLFGQSFSDLFIGFNSVLLYLLVITGFIILLFQCYDMYKRYHDKINGLDII